MNRQASILFNIDSSISDTWLARQEPTAPHSYYQQLIYASLARNRYTLAGFESLGRRLAEIARHAYLARQINAVRQVGQVLLALPISGQLKSIAQHYQAVCAKQRGDYNGARRLLERVAEEATPLYRAQSLQVIGATYFATGQVEAVLPFYLAAGKAAIGCDLLTFAESQKMVAVVRSIHGDHKQALDDLERLLPLARAISKLYPAFYYDYLNSLAVEFGEVGCLDEAKAACSIVLASPFASVYPEFAETRDELEAKRTAATPSIVAVSITPEPAPAPQARTASQAKPICTLAFLWLARKNSVLQTSTAIASAIRLIESTETILDRVRFCIQPRGPPCEY
jgi:tetratricopeptide (TPR) repeat protein